MDKKIGYGFKLFRIKRTEPDKIFPLFVDADKETPMNIWVDAICGERTAKGKVKSKIGELCFRPGWHLTDIPYCEHIGVKGDSGNIEYINANHVWCECEFSSEINYQEEANFNGLNKKGIIIPKNAYLTHIPTDGYYRYKTSPKMYGDWIIAGSIKVNRVLSDEEVREICRQYGKEPLPRYGGDLDLSRLRLIS